MAVDRYSTSRRTAQMDSATGRVADHERATQQDVLRLGLGHLIRTIYAARDRQVVEQGGKPVTYDDARKEYFDLLHMVRVSPVKEGFAELRGVLRKFPEQQRPLLIREAAEAQVLRERYRLNPESYGRDAANALLGIAGGGVRGSNDFSGEPTPIPTVVHIAHDTFESNMARNIVIRAIEERKKRVKAGSAVYFVQDRDALLHLTSTLTLSSGEPVVQALSGVMGFAHEQRDADLLAVSAFTLQEFAENPGNRAAIASQMKALQKIYADLPNTVLGKKILGQILQGFTGKPGRRTT